MSIGNGSTDCAAEPILFEKEFESASHYIDFTCNCRLYGGAEDRAINAEWQAVSKDGLCSSAFALCFTETGISLSRKASIQKTEQMTNCGEKLFVSSLEDYR